MSTTRGAAADGWRVSGGFVVRDLPSGGCEVVHYECYDLPRWLRPARGPLRTYMRHSQGRELRISHDLAVLHSAEGVPAANSTHNHSFDHGQRGC